MLGWLTVFGVLMVSSLSTLLLGKDATVPAVTAGALFAFLFILCLLTRAIRDRA